MRGSSKDDALIAEISFPRKAAHGIVHTFAGEAGIHTIRIIGLIILARLLGPPQFGVFRILLVIAAFASLTNLAGISDALIQREELQPEHIASGWFLTSFLGIVFGVALYTFAPLISSLFRMPELTDAARLLALPIALDSTASVGNATLRRALRFAALASCEVASELLGLIASLLLVWMKRPELALPGGLAARMTVRAIAIWLVAEHPFKVAPSLKAAREMVRFSAVVVSGQFLLMCSSNADYFLVGRILGATALGYYSMAWDLLRFVPNRLARIVVRVAMPLFCRIQERDDRLGEAYCTVISYCSRVILPCVGCLAVLAPYLVRAAYGSRWTPAVIPLQLLAPGLALAGVRLAVGALYYAKDHPGLDVWLHGIRLLLVVGVVSLTAQFGINAVSIGMTVEEAAVTIISQIFVCRLIELGITKLFAAVAPGLLLAAACVLTSLAVVDLTNARHMGYLSTMTIAIGAVLVVFVTTQLKLARKLHQTFVEALLPERTSISTGL